MNPNIEKDFCRILCSDVVIGYSTLVAVIEDIVNCDNVYVFESVEEVDASIFVMIVSKLSSDIPKNISS